MLIEKLTTIDYKFLKILYDNSTILNEQRVVPITQKEIVEISKINKTTVNKIFKELKEYGLVSYEGTRFGKYYITKKGEDIVEKIESIKE